MAGLKRVERTTLGQTSSRIDALIEELAEKASVPEGVRNAVVEYNGGHRIEGRGMRRREAVAALLYIFSKNDLRLNKSINEICEATGADRRLVGRYLVRFTLYGDLELQSRKSEEYLSWLGSKMSASKELVDKGREIITAFRKAEPSGITPRSVAASALYLAARQNGHEFTQGQLASAIGLKEYTVREDSLRMKKALATT